MKIASFFKILNRKINKYDQMTANPFAKQQRVIVIWVEDGEISENRREKG